VNLSGFTPSCCICWKNCVIAFSCCSSFIYLMQKCSIAWCLLPLEPSQVSSVPKPEWFPCLLMFDIWVPLVCLQPEFWIKLISQVFSTSQA
jgi:hypothetical protein